jgi:hypothetical protein
MKQAMETTKENRTDTASFDYRVNKALWCSIQLISLLHLPIRQPNADSTAIIEHRARVRRVAAQLYTTVEQILLQRDIHAAIASNAKLSWTASNLVSYTICFRERLDEARTWLSVMKAYIESHNNWHLRADFKYQAMKLYYRYLRFVLIYSYPKNTIITYRSILKTLKKLITLTDNIGKSTQIISAAQITHDRFKVHEHLKVIRKALKQRATTGPDNLETAKIVIDLFSKIVLDPSALPLAKPSEIVFWRVACHGYKLDIANIEENEFASETPIVIRNEVARIKRSVADDLVSSALEGAQTFLIGGIMLLRPLEQAAIVHLKSTSNNMDTDVSVLPFLLAEEFLLESMKLKYELPSETLTLLFEIKQKITAITLIQQLPRNNTSDIPILPSIPMPMQDRSVLNSITQTASLLPDFNLDNGISNSHNSRSSNSNNEETSHPSVHGYMQQQVSMPMLGFPHQPSSMMSDLDEATISRILSDITPASPTYEEFFDTYFQM